MKAEHCVDNTGTECTGRSICGLDEPGRNHWHSGYLIPAGILIGLGAGMLVDYAWSGFLIGLGLGIAGSSLLNLARKQAGANSLYRPGEHVTWLLIGAFLVFIGIGFVLAPGAIWPYSIAGFLILAGIWFLARAVWRIS